jgi:hypothetical protein
MAIKYIIDNANNSLATQSISGTLSVSNLTISGITSSTGLTKYVVVDDDGNTFHQAGGGGGSIAVADYLTGTTFSNVSNIIFRGGVISVPGATATGVTVTGPAPTVTVWIPAPNYVGYFTPSLGSGGFSRFVSQPTTNGWTNSVAAGNFGTGTWTPGIVTSRNTTNVSSITAFTESEFACYDTNTTFDFYAYKEDGTTIVSSILGYTINGAGSTSSNGLTITISSFLTDGDRYKAAATGTINLATLFPNGGRFSWKIVHNNGEGAGNVSTGVYSYTQTSPVFYDSDGSSSSANISGAVVYDEDSIKVKYYSGVSFYDIGTTFSMTASGLNLLNDITLPVGPQADFQFTNIPISTINGFADGSTGYGFALTGWALAWDNTSLVFSRKAQISGTGYWIGGNISSFGTSAYSFSGNLVNTTPGSSVTTNIYDYSTADTETSASKLLLIDTRTPGSVTYYSNPIDSETGRLSTTGVTGSGTAAFDSTLSLSTTNTDELQYIFGRVIYPQQNFTTFGPNMNSTLSVNYSSLSGANKTYTVYTDLDNAFTTSLAFNDYRWHVTSYTKGGSSFGGGYFTLTSNFTEAVLHYNSTTSSAGSGDLVILLGIDSSGTSTTPDKFIFVSGDFNGPSPIYPGRDDASNYNFSGGTKRIKFTKGSGTPTVAKIWLFVGMKNTVTGKGLYLQNISFA